MTKMIRVHIINFFFDCHSFKDGNKICGLYFWSVEGMKDYYLTMDLPKDDCEKFRNEVHRIFNIPNRVNGYKDFLDRRECEISLSPYDDRVVKSVKAGEKILELDDFYKSVNCPTIYENMKIRLVAEIECLENQLKEKKKELEKLK